MRRDAADVRVAFAVQARDSEYPRYSVLVRAPSDFTRTRALRATVARGHLARGQAYIQIENEQGPPTFVGKGSIVLTLANGTISGQSEGEGNVELEFSGPTLVSCAIPAGLVADAAVPIAVGEAKGEVLIDDEAMTSKQCSWLKTFGHST